MNRVDFLLNEIKKEYLNVACLSRSERGSVTLYVHKKLGKKLVVRSGSGNYSVFEALKNLSSRNIEKIYDAVPGGGTGNFLVLEEYINGEALSSILKRRLFSERETAELTDRLCSALYALGKLNIVHRDIKPENIMIDNAGCLKLIDFGAARMHVPSLTNDTEVIGTIGFAAPEQFGLIQSDFRADIYAVGILMNILLTGQHPSVKLYNGKLKRVIEKCIQTVPEKRYKNILDLRKCL